MTSRTESGRLAIDGGALHYEVRGSGPVLLISQGGASEAGATGELVDVLADGFQVVTYDRRGLSRSSVDDSHRPVTLSTHAEDAAQLLEAVTSEPARVHGTSIGALIGLHLAVEKPDRVSTLVAHEPPMASVVWDVAREHAMDQVQDTFRREGAAPAMRAMAALVGADPAKTQLEDGARPPEPVGDVIANFHTFFTHDFRAVRSCSMTAEDVAAVDSTVIPTGGVLSRGGWEYRCAETLSDHLGRPLPELPGGHGGPVTHPRATASALAALLAGNP